eukprot:4197975-Ditylum_brightwellii.AAC.1
MMQQRSNLMKTERRIRNLTLILSVFFVHIIGSASGPSKEDCKRLQKWMNDGYDCGNKCNVTDFTTKGSSDVVIVLNRSAICQ